MLFKWPFFLRQKQFAIYMYFPYCRSKYLLENVQFVTAESGTRKIFSFTYLCLTSCSSSFDFAKCHLILAEGCLKIPPYNLMVFIFVLLLLKVLCVAFNSMDKQPV